MRKSRNFIFEPFFPRIFTIFYAVPSIRQYLSSLLLTGTISEHISPVNIGHIAHLSSFLLHHQFYVNASAFTFCM